MRTIVDIPDKKLLPVDALCEKEGISRAEFIRQGIDLRLQAQDEKDNNEESKDLRSHPAFGMFKGTGVFGDGVEYQRKIRAEWAGRDREIDIRLGRIKPKIKKKKSSKKS